MSYKLMVFRGSVTGGKRGQIVRECKVKRYLNNCAISSFFILILLFVSYSLISSNFYLFYFPGAAAEPLGLRGAQVGNLWSKRITGTLHEQLCTYIYR